MIVLSQEQITSFQKEILDWYRKNKRDLPWRHPSVKLQNSKERDPYKILVSEVMSQQTQIARVIPKYLAWMERFPTIQDVAEAPTSEILRYWNGLGYNRRALYLQKLAIKIIKDFGEVWPTEEHKLRELPGIGEYTARALLCFAFGKQIPIIDTNVRKVILVKFFFEQADQIKGPSTSSGKKVSMQEIQAVANQLLPKGEAYEWNQALMDYAGAELRAHKIPIPKQSKFKDSNRYYRGQILKMLLIDKSMTQDDLFHLFKQQIQFDRFRKILTTLEKDGFLLIKRDEVILL